MGRRIGAAFVSAALGVLAGAVAYAVAGTLRVMLSPGLEAASPGSWGVGLLLVLAGALFWALLGGAGLVLPAALAMCVARPRSAPAAFTVAALVFVARLGPGGRALDAALLAACVSLGVWTGLRQLERRLAPR